MGQINLARVDDRLIHGKVMQKWTKGKGTDTVIVVDNATAADDFMKSIYVSTNSTGGLKIRVYSTEEVAKSWEKDQFGDAKVALIFKNVKEVKEALDKGLELTELNIGGAAKKPKSKSFIPDVSLTEEEQNLVREISDDGVEVFFQSVPESKRVDFKA